MNIKNLIASGLCITSIVSAFGASIARGHAAETLYDYNNKTYSRYEATLGEMAGRRLYVYGIERNVEEVKDSKSLTKLVMSPDKQITRIEASRLLYNTIKNNINVEINKDKSVFTDVDNKDKELIEAVNSLSELKIANGIGDNKFGCENKLTLKQLSCMILRYINLYTTYDNVITDAEKIGLLDGIIGREDRILTYGDVYIMLGNLIDIDFEGYYHNIVMKEIEDSIKAGKLNSNNKESIDKYYSDTMNKYILDSSKYVITLDNSRFKDEMRRPASIIIDIDERNISSYVDMINDAMEYAPDNVVLKFDTKIKNEDIDTIYNNQIEIQYSWLNNLYGKYEYRDHLSHSGDMQFNLLYKTSHLGNWQDLDNDVEESLVAYQNKLKKDIKLNDKEKEVEFRKELFRLTSNHEYLEINSLDYYIGTYVNLDRQDWIECKDQILFELNTDDFSDKQCKYIDTIDDKANTFLSENIDKLRFMNEHDKIKAVQKIIVEIASYDYDKKSVNTIYNDRHTIIGFLDDGRVVCDGYATTTKWILNYLGIDCVIQPGSGINKDRHAWNKVNILGDWYNLDNCWADTTNNLDEDFLKSDKSFVSTGHGFNSSSFSHKCMKSLNDFDIQLYIEKLNLSK